MDVRIEEVSADLGNKGVLLRISEPGGGKSLGRLWVGKARLKWFPGKTSTSYKEVTMDDFIKWLNSL